MPRKERRVQLNACKRGDVSVHTRAALAAGCAVAPQQHAARVAAERASESNCMHACGAMLEPAARTPRGGHCDGHMLVRGELLSSSVVVSSSLPIDTTINTPPTTPPGRQGAVAVPPANPCVLI